MPSQFPGTLKDQACVWGLCLNPSACHDTVCSVLAIAVSCGGGSLLGSCLLITALCKVFWEVAGNLLSELRSDWGGRKDQIQSLHRTLLCWDCQSQLAHTLFFEKYRCVSLPVEHCLS